MARPMYRMPQPFIHREWVAGERLRVGGLVEYRRDPEDRRHWKLYHPLQPGGDHQNLFVAPNKGLEFVEEGDLALVTQFFGPCEFPAILRKGERVYRGDYERGMTLGSSLASAGDGTGALLVADRFVSVPRLCGTAAQNLNLIGADDDQIVLIRTCIFNGEIAVAG